MLGSAFFWTYALAQVPMGWLAERYGAHRVLAYGLATWALATMLWVSCRVFVMLFILRLLLGLGESVGSRAHPRFSRPRFQPKSGDG